MSKNHLNFILFSNNIYIYIYIYIKGLSYLVAKDLLGLLDGGKKKDLPGETRTAMVYDR
jgi:hypothetical protein